MSARLQCARCRKYAQPLFRAEYESGSEMLCGTHYERYEERKKRTGRP